MTDLEPTGVESHDLTTGQKIMDDLFLALPPEATITIEMTQLVSAYPGPEGRGAQVPPDVLNVFLLAAIGRLEMRVVALERELKKPG